MNIQMVILSFVSVFGNLAHHKVTSYNDTQLILILLQILNVSIFSNAFVH